jgi:hypothetical protein
MKKSQKYTAVICHDDEIRRIVGTVPLLHAYGMGIEVFRNMPEQNRMRAVEYAKYLLAHELKYEIESATRFLSALRMGARPTYQWQKCNWVRSTHLEYVYKYWQKVTNLYAKEIPKGCFAVASFILKKPIFVVDKLKPDFLINVTKDDLKRLEIYLHSEYDFEIKANYLKHYNFKEDRVGEVENTLQSANAVEITNGEENGR